MDRRSFVGAVAAAGTSAFFPGVQLSLAASRLDKIGLQIESIRSQMEQSVERALASVAQIGFKEVEFTSYYGRPARSIRQLLDRNGLRAPSAHIPFTALRGSWFSTLGEAEERGHKFLVISSLGNEETASTDAIKRTAETLNKAADDASRFRIGLGYHCQVRDFREVEGKRIADALLEATNPKRVVMEADLYEMTRAGVDPLDYFTRYPGRFPLVHARDVGPAPAYESKDVGTGTVRWAEIFAKSKVAGIKHVFVERENSADAMASVKASFDYLKALRF